MLHANAVEKLLSIPSIKDTLLERAKKVQKELEESRQREFGKDYVENVGILVVEDHRPLYETCAMFPGHKHLALTPTSLEILSYDIPLENIDVTHDEEKDVRFRLYEDASIRKNYLELSFQF